MRWTSTAKIASGKAVLLELTQDDLEEKMWKDLEAKLIQRVQLDPELFVKLSKVFVGQGISLDGALEVAQNLERKPEAVAVVVDQLLDLGAEPGHTPEPMEKPLDVFRRILDHL